mmetsp:Transcript_11434/g.34729  ORF Transcript_11434/g.34729 Transcript_11434/m.34729 type:complete len:1231 (-) Transcript_11434:269-3961(-)
MLTKFESKSNRVKGLAFHPARPWILTSLHNGVIQLWDYCMGTLLEKFDEHDGPVRGVDFHSSQPLIVSGGDDYKIKVWDYKLRRCLFTLLGHLDYIRTVQFHNEYPWIISASDDQTIRIWNWQSRVCINVLTGHNHYVMCAGFHPKDDLVVSASLDQTVRVWDTSGLRKKHVRGAPSAEDNGVVGRVNADLFGGTDAVVKYVLEGHDRGVNWASFHPTLPLVVSGADDRQVKLWRMNETKAWEVDTMRGHSNNVSCVIFHPKHELIMSNSEDRSIRVWDISKRLGVQTFRREKDRFWILAAHPSQNLLAAGHDSGMIVFKLERERPAYDVHGGSMTYVKDRYLRQHDFGSSRDAAIVSLWRAGNSQTPGIGHSPRTLLYNHFNPAESNVLVLSDMEGGTYDLLTFPNSTGSSQTEPSDSRRGSALSAIFLARNRFAVLDKSRQIIVKNLQNEEVKRLAPPQASADCLFFGGVSGRMLVRSEDRVTLFEQASRRVLGELQVPRIKYVVWNKDCSQVALLTKHSVVICNRDLEQQATVTETVRVKSGGWDSRQKIFIYTTANLIKYALPNGDAGIIRSLDAPMYVTKVHGNQLFCVDRECRVRTLTIDTTEAKFKLALDEKRYGDVMQMVRSASLCGKAIISYLQKKGFPEVALHFVEDNKTRFRLALECGNIEVAMNVAHELGDDQSWAELGQEALRQGNHQVVEMAYQRTKDFERLSFLYLVTGNLDKLRKMCKIAELRGDNMSRFQNALFLGDAEERVKVLEETQQLSLAYLTAATHGLDEAAERLKLALERANLTPPDLPTDATLLQPPTPIIRAENWPLLTVQKTVLENPAIYDAAAGADDDDDFQDPAGDGWGDDLGLGDDDDLGLDTPRAAPAEVDPNAWGDDLDDLDLGDDDDDDMDLGGAAKVGGGAGFSVPTAGVSPSAAYVNNSSHCADHAAAGAIESAMNLLHRQIAAADFLGMKEHLFAAMLGASVSLPGLPLTPSLSIPLQRSTGEKALPLTPLKIAHLKEELRNAFRAFHAAQFADSKAGFLSILAGAPLVVPTSRAESDEVLEMVEVCREYITGIRLKEAIDAAGSDPVRQTELSAYFTHCNMQPAHLLLALRQAMATAFKKSKCYILAAGFAQRLLELPDMSSERNASLRSTAMKVMKKSNQEARNEVEVDYDERNPFELDCEELTPVYRGADVVHCPYCKSAYKPKARGKRCKTCGIAVIGKKTLGLLKYVPMR